MQANGVNGVSSAMASINLNDEHLTAVVSASILQALTGEAREALITNAIKDLLTKSSSGYGGGDQRSELQKIFSRSVEMVATNIVRKSLEEDENFNAKIKTLISEVTERFFDETQRAALVETLATGITNALKSTRY